MNEQATEQQRNIYTQARQISFGDREITEKHAVGSFCAPAFQQSLAKRITGCGKHAEFWALLWFF